MSVRSVSVTEAALRDVQEIAQYIALDSPASANLFEAEFAAAVERIREFPGMGLSRRGLPINLLLARISSRFRRYLIAYRLLDDRSHLQIVRVLHSARDISRELARR